MVSSAIAAWRSEFELFRHRYILRSETTRATARKAQVSRLCCCWYAGLDGASTCRKNVAHCPRLTAFRAPQEVPSWPLLGLFRNGPGSLRRASIWHATTAIKPLYRDVIRMLMITGQRRTEIGRMRWGEVDLAKALWTLPSARTKLRREHIVPLAPLAVEILNRRRALFRSRPPADDDWVFDSLSRDHQHIVPVGGWGRMKRYIERAAPLHVIRWSSDDARRRLELVTGDVTIATTGVTVENGDAYPMFAVARQTA